MKIPRVIHQTIENMDQLLPEYSDNRSTMALINPNWTFKLYTSKDRREFIQNNFDSRILDSYLSIDKRYGAARADFFRYLVVYVEGGLYLDIKSSAIKPLDEVIKDDDTFVTANWPSQIDGIDISNLGMHSDLEFLEYQNWFILSSPRNQILKDVIEGIAENIKNYSPVRDGVGKHGVLRTTGPIAYSRIIHPYVKNGLARMSTNEDLGFRPTIYRIESNERPFPNKQKSTHYSDLRFPIVRVSTLNSLAVALLFRFKEKINRLNLIIRKSIFRST